MANAHAHPQSTDTVSSSISATTSPQVITNTLLTNAQVIVTGGTVSAIDLWTRASTTYVSTGLTVGVFLLGPADKLKVTYSSNPTMTLLPM